MYRPERQADVKNYHIFIINIVRTAQKAVRVMTFGYIRPLWSLQIMPYLIYGRSKKKSESDDTEPSLPSLRYVMEISNMTRRKPMALVPTIY